MAVTIGIRWWVGVLSGDRSPRVATRGNDALQGPRPARRARTERRDRMMTPEPALEAERGAEPMSDALEQAWETLRHVADWDMKCEDKDVQEGRDCFVSDPSDPDAWCPWCAATVRLAAAALAATPLSEGEVEWVSVGRGIWASESTTHVAYEDADEHVLLLGPYGLRVDLGRSYRVTSPHREPVAYSTIPEALNGYLADPEGWIGL